MDGRPTWTDCDEAGDYVVPNVLSPRDLVSRPDLIDETVPHTKKQQQTQTEKTTTKKILLPSWDSNHDRFRGKRRS